MSPRRKITPKVKICGITSYEDAAAAIAAGADLLGFVCDENDPRYIGPEQLQEWIGELHHAYPTDAEKPAYRTVGIFTDKPAAYIAAIMALTGLDWAQLNGAEPVSVLAQLHKRAYKAIHPRAYKDADAEASFYAAHSPRFGPRLLIDAYRPDMDDADPRPDWEIAKELARFRSILLSGGLTPQNVAAAVRTVHPWGVDVREGVEKTPGRKDAAAMQDFVRKAKTALREQ